MWLFIKQHMIDGQNQNKQLIRVAGAVEAFKAIDRVS
jgi:hypothetical protein